MIDNERLHPQELTYERALLGLFMVSRDTLVSLRAELTTESFYHTNNRKIYESMLLMLDKDIPIDIITLSNYLRDKGQNELESYVLELSESLCTRENAPYYAKTLVEKEILRNFIDTCHSISSSAFGDNPEINNLLMRLEDLRVTLSSKCDRVNIKYRKTGEIKKISEFKEAIKNYHKKIITNPGVSPGKQWKGFEKLYKPAKGYLNVVTGIPGGGKSEFIDALMVNLSLEQDWKFAVFSPENYPVSMHVKKLSEKLIGKSFFDQMSSTELDTAIEFINDHFFILKPDEENLTVENLLKLNLEAIKKYGVDGSVWDPWGELDINIEKNKTETIVVGNKLAKIRRHCERNNYIQFIVAHPTKIYKNPKTGKYNVPTLYDISGSANWRNRADNGFCVYRNYDTNIVDVHVQKMKFKEHGNVGCVSFEYDKISGQYSEQILHGFEDDTHQVDIWQNK